MKLVRSLSVAGVGLVAVGAVAIAQGCSSSSSPAAAPVADAGGASIVPPTKPTSAGATTSKSEHNYALKTLLLGDTDRSLLSSTTAWKAYGFNLDGKISTKDSVDVCTQFAGASKSVQVDGNGGIDNSFGSNIVPIIQGVASHDVSKTISDNIAAGAFTIMIDTVGLSDDAMQTNTGITAQLFAGGKFTTANPDGGAGIAATPTFTIADKWSVTPALLNDGKTVAGGSKVKFSDAFIVNGTWVNGSPASVTLTLAFSGVSLDITINQATMVFDHQGATAANGTIAGVINTEDLITGLQKVAGRISSSLCSGSAFDSIAQQIRQASDIMHDGTNVAGTPCDGISIGVGFTAAEIAPPSVVADLGPATPDMCSGDAGAGADDAGSAVDSGAADAAH